MGSNLNKATISDGDYSNMKNYLGLENREPDTPTFGSQIRDHFADLNDNGVYDVYDYSFTMAGLDGGTKQKGKVAGSLAVIPSKTEVEAGDEITVDVYAADAKNVNALGALVNFKSDQFEFVSESIAQDARLPAWRTCLARRSSSRTERRLSISPLPTAAMASSTTVPARWRVSSSRPRPPARSNCPRHLGSSVRHATRLSLRATAR